MFKEGLKTLKLAKGIKDFKTATDLESKKAAAQFINDILDSEKGLFLKVGQYMGSKANALEDFKTLTKSRKKAIPLEELIPHINSNLGRNYKEVFSKIEESEFPASIGQVHRCLLKNGDQVALKVQYPNMREKIKSQLKLLNLLPVKGVLNPMKKWDIDLTSYLDMIQKKLDEELSYKNEMNNQEKFGQMVSGMDGVSVSTIYRDLSSDALVVQSFEQGSFVDEVAKVWNKNQKNEAGLTLLNVFFNNLFKDGFLQGDCNIGNYLFRSSQKGKTEVVFIDFGNCVEIKPEVSRALWKIIQSVKRKESVDISLDLLVQIGFDREKLKPIKGQLSELLKIIFEPFLENGPYDLSQWKIKERVDHVLGEKKWWFRSAGNTDFFEIMKSFFGVVNLLEILEAKICWHEVMESIDFED
ncbi:MAG: AarF/UbiB family protein [Bdellovibrionota bacterium]|nr:AarF/UbiB family protein [Bdellovibrionota bacterium]